MPKKSSPRLLRLDDKQGLPEFDKLAVLRDYLDDRAFDGGAHAVEDFHDLDQTDGGVFRDLLADLCRKAAHRVQVRRKKFREAAP